MRQKRRGISLLAMVLAALVILVALIGALHHSEQVARRNNLGAEAELQLLQARRWELGHIMRTLPANVVPSHRLEVQATIRAAANGTQIPAQSGAKLFDSGNDNVWNGLPNLLVTRSDTNLQPSPPPTATEYRDQAVSSNSALGSTFSGRHYRYMVSSNTPYAAYAPLGSINLDSVVGWSNPPMASDDGPLELFSGQPTLVAAGNTVNVTNIPYGTLYSRHADIKFTSGLALPLAGRFPVRSFEADYASNISTNQASLGAVAAARSDKTAFISGEPPGVETMLGMMTGDAPNLTDWLSLRSSLQWKCPTIPGFTTVAVPVTYVAFAFWFHAPYPPDGVDTGTDPFEELEAYYDRLEALNRRKKLVERNLRQLSGGEAIPGDADQHVPTQPAVEGLVPRWNRLRPLLQADRDALATSDVATRMGKAARPGQTTKEFFALLADGGPHGVLAERGQTYDSAYAGDRNLRSHDLLFPTATGVQPRATMNFNLERTSLVFPPDVDGHADISRLPTPKFAGTEQSSTDTTKLSEPDWKNLLEVKPGLTQYASNEQTQFEFLDFILTNDLSMFKKFATWQTNYQSEVDRLQDQIEALEGPGGEIETFLQDLRNRSDNDPSLVLRANEIRTNGRSSPPYSHSRYGYSFDLLWNLIVDGINGDLQKRWQPTQPLVWFGTPLTNQQGAMIPLANSLTMRATLTVPQARTFCYNHPLTISGDLWLQRGSTMLVRGDLSLRRLDSADPVGPVRMNFFYPSGRLIMEEGSTLIVEGNFSCQGTRERGSVVLTTVPKQLHPINAALLVQGSATIPYGVINGLGITDVLPLVSPALNTVMYPLLTSVAPNLAKLVGPFHRRFCFFSRKCTEYQLSIFIGPFGIPIPVMYPFVGLRNNVWVPMYRGLAMFFQVVDNMNMGEYLYPQSDWWPFGHQDGVGQVPVIPKLDPSSVLTHIRSVTLALPTADSVGDFIVSFWPTLLESVQNEVIKKIMVSLATSLVPYAPPGVLDAILTPIFERLTGEEGSLDSKDPTSSFVSILNPVVEEFKNKVTDWMIAQSEPALLDAMAHEVQGLLLSANTIKIGVGVEPAPYLACGCFFARGDVDINARYTVGSIISQTGSINGKTQLLFYPLYSLAGLYKPVLNPGIEGRGPLNAFTGALSFVRRAGNYEYGKYADPGTGVDVGMPGVTRVTAEGWQ